MDRREFVKLTPAFAAGAVSASLVLREDGKEPVELDVSVLKLREGDTLVMSTAGPIPAETAERIKVWVEDKFPGIRAMVMGDSLRVDGVLRRE